MEKVPEVIHSSWYTYLQPLFDDEKMKMIKHNILTSCNFYPNSSDIFRVFSMPLEDIKVVILGQDPYPNGEAIGLAFAVNENTTIPASLRVIHKEVEYTVESPDPSTRVDRNKWKTLNHWVNQGVFLLNTSLTVESKNAGSHLGIWQWFTREVIKIISKNNSCIWMLWGAKAQTFRDYIIESHPILNTNSDWDNINPKQNFILQASHPAAELYGGKQKFSGCNHFNLCNEILKIQNKQLINW